MRSSLFALGLAIVTCAEVKVDLWPDMPQACPHQYTKMVNSWENITLLGYASKEIAADHLHLYYYESYNYINSDRRIIFRLEPCSGIQYLYIRRTRPCWPNPKTGEWSHYMSNTDGASDAQQTLLEVPATSTRWFITVFAKSSGRYALSIVYQPEHFPRVIDGHISSEQLSKDVVQISWNQAGAAQSSIERYLIYSSMVFETVAEMPAATRRIMTTVCGLQQNTDHPYAVVSCADAICRANVSSLVHDRRYFFNVVADSGLVQSAFDGIQVRTFWDTSTADSVRQAAVTASIVLATVTGILVASWFTLYKLYM